MIIVTMFAPLNLTYHYNFYPVLKTLDGRYTMLHITHLSLFSYLLHALPIHDVQQNTVISVASLQPSTL